MDLNRLCAQTPRCVVRFLGPGDYESFLAGYRECLPPQNRFDEGPIELAGRGRAWYDAMLERRRCEAEKDICYMFHIFRRADGRALGYCDITTQCRADMQYAKIGYTIFNNYWRQGFGAEALAALTDIGFEQLHFHRLEAHINIDNPASKAVVTKCGYQFEGIRRGFIYEDGVWTDNEVYYRNAPGRQPPEE